MTSRCSIACYLTSEYKNGSFSNVILIQVEMQLDQGFVPTCMAHPDTYVNKIVIGSIAGQLQLWNFVSGKLLFTFQIASCAVRCIAPSPALDVVGIGMADG